jgi:hypothetical protein
MIYKIREVQYKDFCDDEEKMADFFLLSKSEFFTQYSYITEEEWSATYKEMEKFKE